MPCREAMNLKTSRQIYPSVISFFRYILGNVEQIKHLESLGGNPIAPDSEGMTPLHHAVRHNHLNVVEYFIETLPKEALNAQDTQRRQTALHKVG